MKNNIPKEIFPDNVILCGYRGSVSHNTYIPDTDPHSTEDIDVIGVYFAPIEYYFGLDYQEIHNIHRKAIENFINQYDGVFYELKKIVRLLLRSNPNVLSLVWLRKEHYINISAGGQKLINAREDFLSKHNVYNSFTGYANGQLKRMTHFKKEGYMGKKRKALVKQYGYDFKNASHLIRLLRMAIEILKTGQVNVFRTDDAEMLKEIKTGKWSLEKVKKEADLLFKETHNAYKNSVLPDEPNYQKIEKVLIDILWNYLAKVKYIMELTI